MGLHYTGSGLGFGLDLFSTPQNLGLVSAQVGLTTTLHFSHMHIQNFINHCGKLLMSDQFCVSAQRL